MPKDSAPGQKKKDKPPVEPPPPPPPEEEEPPVEEPPDEPDPEVEEPPLPEEEDPAFPTLPQSTKLDQRHGSQREMARWISTLSEADVTIPTEAPRWDYTFPDDEWLAELWMELGSVTGANEMKPLDPELGKRVQTSVFHGAPRWFTLAGIEDVGGLPSLGAGYETIRHARRVYPPAYWYNRSLPWEGGEGNPFYRNRALANRVMATTAVGIIMSEYWYEWKDSIGAVKGNPYDQPVYMSPDSRFLGGQLNGWAYAYEACRSVLPASTRRAFEVAFKRMVLRLLAQKTGKNTPNMTTRAIPGLAILQRIAEDSELRAMSLQAATNFVTGYVDGRLWSRWLRNSLCYPAGFVQEGFGPETTYNGVSMYHLTEAYCRGTDAFRQMLNDFLPQMARFRGHQLFPADPAGTVLIGPSAYAGRTGAGWERLQAGRPSHPWRDTAMAALWDEALPFHEQKAGKEFATPDKMLANLKNAFKLASGQRIWFGDTTRPQWELVSKGTLDEFRLDHDLSWPGYVVYHAPVPNWQDRIASKVGDPLMQPPFLRTGYTFSESFADDFWSRKAVYNGQEFGHFVESCADGGLYGGYRGGSLQAFWTKATGVVILGRHNKATDERVWANIDTWATHHLWGRTSAGLFSSAVERLQGVAYDQITGTVTVTVTGPMNGSDQQAPAQIDRVTRFRALEDGLRIEHGVTGTFSELWATLPVYLMGTTIEYLDGSSYRALGTGLVSTTRLRLGRGGAYVYVRLDAPMRVKLSSSVWTQTYQATTQIRNVHIDLSASGGAYELGLKP